MLIEIVLVVVLPTVIAVVAAVLLSRRRTVRDGDSDSDSVSFAGGVVGALFTVVLAFYVVFAWQLGDDISADSTVEANALVDAYWQAELMPPAARARTQQLVRGYAEGVVQHEWAELATGSSGPAVAAADASIGSLRTVVAGLPTDDDAMQSVRDNAMADVRQIDESHRARVDSATNSDAFTVVLLAATIVGAILMIAFPLIVGVSARPANLLAVAVLTFTVAATVYISIELATPLSGSFAVKPDKFSDAVSAMSPTPAP